MTINRTRLMQGLGLAVLSVIVSLPLDSDIPVSWPQLTQEEREIEVAVQELQKAEQIAGAPVITEEESAESETKAKAPVVPKRAYVRRPKPATTVATAVEPQPEAPASHYTMRNPQVQRQIAKCTEKNNCLVVSR